MEAARRGAAVGEEEGDVGAASKWVLVSCLHVLWEDMRGLEELGIKLCGEEGGGLCQQSWIVGVFGWVMVLLSGGRAVGGAEVDGLEGW